MGLAEDHLQMIRETEPVKEFEQKVKEEAEKAKEEVKKKIQEEIAKSFGDFDEAWASPEDKAALMKERDNLGQFYNTLTQGKKKDPTDAFHGKIEIDGKKYGIVECWYEITQGTDTTGKPSGKPNWSKIVFTMPATSNDDTFFYDWMAKKTETHDGMLTFVVWSRQNKRVFKNLRFKDAYCVGIKDYFNDNDSKLMYSTITIACDTMIFGAPSNGGDKGGVGVLFSNGWKKLKK